MPGIWGGSGRRIRLGRNVRLRSLSTKPWLGAPLLLARYPGILLAVGTAVGILAITAASGPLFLSSVGNAAFQNDLRSQCPWTSGLQSTGRTWMTSGQFLGENGSTDVATIDRRIRATTRAIPHVARPQWQVLTNSLTPSAKGVQFPPPVKLYARPDALAHVRKLRSAGGEGVWIPDRIADALKVDAGANLRLAGFQGRPAKVRVAGVYRDLSTLPRSTFWCGQGQHIHPIGDALPPALVLADLPTLEELSGRLRGTDQPPGFPVTLTWSLPVSPDGVTLSDARRLDRALEASQDRVRITGFEAGSVQSGLTAIVERAQAVVDGTRASVGTIGVAGSLVALLVVAGAGIFWAHRRRSEAAVLVSKGFGPGALLLKVLLEVLPASLLGVVAGWAVSVWLVMTLGPVGLLDAGVAAAALRRVAWIAAIGIVVLAGVAAAAVRRDTEPARAGRRSVRGAPWEPAVMLLAAASLYEVLARGPVQTTPQGTPKVDVLVLLFPILFVTGGSGLASRAIRRALPVLRRAGRRWPPALYLATRRLAGAPGIALALLTATGLSTGVLAYASLLSASVQATSEAKAKVFTGSDLSVTLIEPVPVPPQLAGRATMVWASEQALIPSTQDRVGVLGIDPASFGRAAFWDPSFADDSLADLLDGLLPSDDGDVPMIATGGPLPGRGTIDFRERATGGTGAPVEVPFRVVATTRAFPGMTSGRPLLVGLRSALEARGVHGAPKLWVRGNPDAALEALRAAKAPILISVTARDAESTPAFLALTWTFGFLQSLGVVIGLIVLGGMLLYLEAHQRTRAIAYALSGRMGLSKRAHRASVGVELGAMLAIGTVVGAFLAWGAGRLIFGRLDLLPKLPPPPLFRTPLGLFGLMLLAVVVVSWLGAWEVHRAAERAHVTEVIRIAG